MNTFLLSRYWFSYSWEHTERITATHTALYFYLLELGNQLGWKPVFGVPTDFVMSAINIGSWRTYTKTFDDLAEFGFIKVVSKAKNQHSSTRISITKEAEVLQKCLCIKGKSTAKALQKHIPKQDNSKDKSTAVIDKLLNLKTIKLINKHHVLIEGNLEKWIDEEISKNKDSGGEVLIDIFPFTIDFFNNWDKWKRYKKDEHRFRFKKIETEQAAFNDLLKISGGDQVTAAELIDYAISKQWKGIYPKSKTNANTTNTPEPKFGRQTKSAIDRLVNGGTIPDFF